MPDVVIFNRAQVLLSTTTALGSFDISNRVKRVRLQRQYDIHDVTAMGETDRARAAGLAEWSAEVSILQSFTTADGGENTDLLLNNLAELSQSGSKFMLAISPCSTDISGTNPRYNGLVIMESYQPLDGEVGDPLEITVPFLSAGSLYRASSSGGEGV